MKQKRKTHPAVMVLSLIVPLILIGLGWLCHDILGTRVGADTEYGAVYKIRLHGQTLYQWYVFRRDGTVWESDITELKPYIYENEDVITLRLMGNYDGIDTHYEFYNYFLDRGTIEEGVLYGRPDISRNLKLKHHSGKAVKTGSDFVEIKDLTLHDIPLYYWCVYDTAGEFLWDDTCEAIPEVTEDNEKITLYFEEDGIQLCQEFFLEDGHFPHEYTLFEEGTVFVENAVGQFTSDILEYDTSTARTENFVHTSGSAELTVPNDYLSAYTYAKEEVTIPYSLVTFRCHPGALPNVSLWEVTFSQKDDPDGDAQTVYMDNTGTTILILDGRPEN